MNSMTARSIGSPTISFGLVSIPTKLYTTNESSSDISFNLLHDADGARLKQQHICSVCGEVVDKDHQVKGYMHAKDQYVVISAAELESLDALATDVIEIKELVPGGEMDPVYCDKSYYLLPDKGSERGFRLLAAALHASKRVAVGTYAARGKQHIVVIAAAGEMLMLHQLRYQHEIKPVSELPEVEPLATPLKPAELKAARQLIELMASDTLDLGRYQDDVQIRTRALIEAKVAGEEIVVAPTAAPATTVDMIAALTASLAVPRDRKARAAAVSRKSKPSTSKRAAAR